MTTDIIGGVGDCVTCWRNNAQPWDICIGAGESVVEAYRDWERKVVGKKPTLEDKQRHFEKTKMENFKHSSRLEGIVYD